MPVSNITLAILSGKVTPETIKNNKYLPKSKKEKKKERKKERNPTFFLNDGANIRFNIKKLMKQFH